MPLRDLLNTSSQQAILRPSRERARALIRVSHERSAEKNISPETQRRTIQAYADQQGYEIAEWYTELAISAFRDEHKRTEFRRLIEDAKRDPLTSVILVYKYNRFSRLLSASGLQEELFTEGVRIESVTEGYHDPETETGAIMGSLTWGLSKFQSIQLRNVVIPNMKTNFEQRDPQSGWAFKNGGWAQWGYRTQRVEMGKNGRGDIRKQIWVLDNTEVAGRPVWQWARTMLLDWRLAERMGYDRVAARLTELGIPTPTGRSAWCVSSIQALLGDMSRLFQYSGYAFWNREDCSDRRARRQRDPSEWIVVENAHPAIITETQCEAIWSMVSGRHKPKSGRSGEASRFALSGGLLKCAHCGANFAGVKQRAGDYYVCGSHLYRRGAGCGPAWYIPREQLETALVGRIAKLMRMPDAGLEEWIAEANGDIEAEWQEYRRAAGARKKRLAEFEAKAKNLAAAIATSGPLPQLLTELTEVNGFIARLQRIETAERPEPMSVERIRAFRAKAELALSPIELEARREVLRNVVIELVVDAEKKRVDGRIADLRSAAHIWYAAPRGVVGNVDCRAQYRSLRLTWLRNRFRTA